MLAITLHDAIKRHLLPLTFVHGELSGRPLLEQQFALVGEPPDPPIHAANPALFWLRWRCQSA
jgi:hypothetical protein